MRRPSRTAVIKDRNGRSHVVQPRRIPLGVSGLSPEERIQLKTCPKAERKRLAQKLRQSRQTKRFKAHLAPHKPNGPTRTRFYPTAKRARAAQTSSWAHFQSLKAIHAAAQTQDEFDDRFFRCNTAEQRFIRWADDRGMKLQRGGWPDFFAQSPSGNLAAIEVKSSTDMLRPDQRRCMTLLERAGINSYVWTQKQGLEPWKEYVKRRLAADASAKAAGQSENSCQSERREPQQENPAPDERAPEDLEHTDATLH